MMMELAVGVVMLQGGASRMACWSMAIVQLEKPEARFLLHSFLATSQPK